MRTAEEKGICSDGLSERYGAVARCLNEHKVRQFEVSGLYFSFQQYVIGPTAYNGLKDVLRKYAALVNQISEYREEC
jgi:hypothetical protein